MGGKSGEVGGQGRVRISFSANNWLVISAECGDALSVGRSKLLGRIARTGLLRVGGNRSKERDRKSELVLRSTYQTFEWDRNNSDRNFYNVVRYVHIPLVP